MEAGKYTYGIQNIMCHWASKEAGLTIGKFCSIAANVNIYLGGGHRTDWITTYPFGHINAATFDNPAPFGHPKSNGSVVIGNDVWVASNVTIMSGITIGDGCVIANNSHVVKDCEPYGIYGGNPAKLIKKRFSPEQIEKLLELKWWNLSDEKINELIPVLCSGDIEKLF